RARDPEAQRPGLPGHAAATDPGDHVELALGAERHQRFADELLVHLVREEHLQRPVVDPPLAGARSDPDAGDRLLGAARPRRVAGNPRRRRGPAARLVGSRLGGVLRGSIFLGWLVSAHVERLRVCGLSHGAFLALSSLALVVTPLTLAFAPLAGT